MFQQGERVVYGIHGVCSIVDIEVQNVNRKKVEYYVLVPVNQEEARFYVPTQNQAAVAKLRRILTKQELDALLRSNETDREVWIVDENQRKQHYRELINGGDRAALICMIRSLHKHKKQQFDLGRKFHLCDENFLRDAEKLLSSEFSLVLGIDRNDVGAYIQKILDEK